jgi:ATP-binding cassette subfamily B multidrug efflux pump
MYEAPEGLAADRRPPVRDYPLAVLRHNIGMVPQETFLFSETIRENLAFGAPHASSEELLEAAEAAHIRLEFEEFPQGFETMVGERGVTLSGGQKAACGHRPRTSAPSLHPHPRRRAGQRGYLH